jgi:hypothetical protein
VESFGCEGMFFWTHSGIMHSLRFEPIRFSIYSSPWAFKPFVLLTYDSHHEFIEIAVPTSCLTRIKPNTHTPLSALYANVLYFTSHPQPQPHTPLPYPSRNAPTVSQPLATSGSCTSLPISLRQNPSKDSAGDVSPCLIHATHGSPVLRCGLPGGYKAVVESLVSPLISLRAPT